MLHLIDLETPEASGLGHNLSFETAFFIPQSLIFASIL
jgi:hypothetical protein